MRKRNCRVEVRLTETELSELKKKAWETRLSNGGFIRRAIADQEIKPAPPADVPMLIREVRRVGYNIEQILKIANAWGMLDVPRLREALEENRDVEKMIMDTYTMADE